MQHTTPFVRTQISSTCPRRRTSRTVLYLSMCCSPFSIRKIAPLRASKKDQYLFRILQAARKSNVLGQNDGIAVFQSVRKDCEREVGFRDCASWG